jgi:hypothetical protein
MTIRKILVMHSIQDETFDERTQVLDQLSEYEFFHFFIREESGNDVDKMARVLEGTIETLNPDLVLVHLSLAYFVIGEPYLQVIDDLQRKFTGVLFVADRELRPEHEGKYAIRTVWEDPSGELLRISMAASFGIISEGGGPR